MIITISIKETSTIYHLSWCWLDVMNWLNHHCWTDGYSFFLWKNIIFGVMQISCVDHRIQMLQLLMGSWETRCIILDLIRSNDNVGDHVINLQYLRITACTADIISLYQNEFPSSCLHCHNQTIDHFAIFITHCSSSTALYFCMTLHRWQYFEI